MPRFTAMLLNERGRVTLHECVRLEVRRRPRPDAVIGRMTGVYPIYQCTETYGERIYGCLALSVRWENAFPGVHVEEADPDLIPAADEAA